MSANRLMSLADHIAADAKLASIDFLAKPARGAKYGNRKTEARDGTVCDSRAEAARWDRLCMLQRGGAVRELRRQVLFELAPPVKFAGITRTRPALRYQADFVYQERQRDGSWLEVVEDCKGVQTPVFKVKRHLMKSVHNIDLRLTK